MSNRIKSMRPASFRGVPFSVDEDEIEAGRRVQAHEYPKRDKPFHEDMGRATRAFTVTGFVVGDDYVEQANRLLAEFEKPGTATLVHPWLGSLQVVLVEPVRMRRSGREIGVIRFELRVSEAGELQFPAVQTSAQSASRIAAGKVSQAAVTQFERSFNVVGVADFVQSMAESKLGVLAKSLTGALPVLPALGDARKFARLGADWVGMVRDPGRLALSVAGSVGIAGYVGQAQDLRAVVDGLLSVFRSSDISPRLPPSVYTSNRQQAWRNDEALSALTRQSVLAQVVGASSLLDLSVYDDSVAARDAIVAALDDEALRAGEAAYGALLDARAAVWSDMTGRARSAARLQAYRPQSAVPALVLSHRLYGTADRADEIVTRNRVRHPGFVPPVDLQVLSS